MAPWAQSDRAMEKDAMVSVLFGEWEMDIWNVCPGSPFGRLGAGSIFFDVHSLRSMRRIL